MSADDQTTEDAAPARPDTMIAALLRERAGYAQHGRDDRVALVDEQLKLRGHTEPDDQPRGAKPAAKRQQQTRA